MSGAERTNAGHARSWDQYPHILAGSVRADEGYLAPREVPSVYGPKVNRGGVITWLFVAGDSLGQDITPTNILDLNDLHIHVLTSAQLERAPLVTQAKTTVPTPPMGAMRDVESRTLRAELDALKKEVAALRGQVESASLVRQEAHTEPRVDDTILWAGDWVDRLHADYAGQWVALRREGLIAAANNLAQVMDVVRRPEFADVRVFVTRISK